MTNNEDNGSLFLSALFALTNLFQYMYSPMNKFIYMGLFNPTALRKAKSVCNFGLSESNRVK